MDSIRSPVKTNCGRKSVHVKALVIPPGNTTRAHELDQFVQAMEFFEPEAWTTSGAKFMALI
jgi:hypothetical protein